MEKTLTPADLRQFIGSETRYRHSRVRHILYTEGMQYVAEQGSAYWLLDKIAFAQLQSKIAAEPFQLWTLTVNTDCTASSSARMATAIRCSASRSSTRISRSIKSSSTSPTTQSCYRTNIDRPLLAGGFVSRIQCRHVILAT